MTTASSINAMLDELWPDARVRCLAVSETAATVRVRTDSNAIRPGGFISGPAQFAAADSAMWFLVCGVAGAPEPMALTSELSIRFLRPAVGDALHAEAHLERAGRRTIVATVRVWTTDPDKPCATAQGTYVRAAGE